MEIKQLVTGRCDRGEMQEESETWLSVLGVATVTGGGLKLKLDFSK